MLDSDNQALVTSVFRDLAREVWVVTAADGARRGGLTATWVHVASLDAANPLVLIAIAANHFTCELLDWGGVFAVHLLRADQSDLAWKFASTSSREGDKFTGLAVTAGSSGAPLLDDCLARLECRVIHRVGTGDRIFYWGEVVAAARFDSTAPLTDRQFFQTIEPAQRQTLIEQLQADIQIQRPLWEAWRKPSQASQRPSTPGMNSTR